ncbi:MAG: hypothetical protein ACRED4_02390, partial [Brevundimonas sp.]
MVTRPLLNAGDLAAWARREGFRDLRPEAWHVSVVRAVQPFRSLCVASGAAVHIAPSSDRTVRRLGPFVALTFESDTLTARHHGLLAAGATWDHPTYRPHVTFSVEPGPFLEGVSPYMGPLIFGSEEWPKRSGVDARQLQRAPTCRATASTCLRQSPP